MAKSKRPISNNSLLLFILKTIVEHGGRIKVSQPVTQSDETLEKIVQKYIESIKGTGEDVGSVSPTTLYGHYRAIMEFFSNEKFGSSLGIHVSGAETERINGKKLEFALKPRDIQLIRRMLQKHKNEINENDINAIENHLAILERDFHISTNGKMGVTYYSKPTEDAERWARLFDLAVNAMENQRLIEVVLKNRDHEIGVLSKRTTSLFPERTPLCPLCMLNQRGNYYLVCAKLTKSGPEVERIDNYEFGSHWIIALDDLKDIAVLEAPESKLRDARSVEVNSFKQSFDPERFMEENPNLRTEELLSEEPIKAYLIIEDFEDSHIDCLKEMQALFGIKIQEDQIGGITDAAPRESYCVPIQGFAKNIAKAVALFESKFDLMLTEADMERIEFQTVPHKLFTLEMSI